MTSIGDGPWPGAADLVRLWSPAHGSPATARVRELLVALHGVGVHRDPLGVHHQRVLALHQAAVGRAIEAVVGCAGCDIDNEFTVPVAAICALPAPAPDAAARLALAGGEARFRLPTVADLDAVAGTSYGEGVRALAARTRLDADPSDLATADLTELDLALLARAWEELDPAGSVQVDLACAGCGAGVAADVTVAEFVARDLDRTVEGLLRDVDVIARVYGWSEDAILGLPAERRRRYVDLAGSADRPSPRRLAAVLP
jgi:hypothetical protein